MNASKLKSAIDAVNIRHAQGLNDDDLVRKMCDIAQQTKGYHFYPLFDTYELVTDEEFFKRHIAKYGYWSDEVKRFNSILTQKGGTDYMAQLNCKLKPSTK